MARTLVVGSEYDHIIPAEETRATAFQIKNSQYAYFYGCGYGTMYEKSEPFIQAIKPF
ncbi:MAG: alpha/beta hydrolase [Clostridia bacterium]|nr:alpha/beta hydrolase [Clostridia bacterium]